MSNNEVILRKLGLSFRARSRSGTQPVGRICFHSTGSSTGKGLTNYQSQPASFHGSVPRKLYSQIYSSTPMWFFKERFLWRPWFHLPYYNIGQFKTMGVVLSSASSLLFFLLLSSLSPARPGSYKYFYWHESSRGRQRKRVNRRCYLKDFILQSRWSAPKH